MLEAILEKVYGRIGKNKEKLSHHAIKFCEKHGLSLTEESKTEDLIVAFSMLSNKEKKEMAIRMVLSSTTIEKEVVKKDTDLLSLREQSYKIVCKKFHPDNTESGDEGVFKFIQEIKFAFWDCDGKPRKDISYREWTRESNRKKNPIFKY
jgi:hypothetical protein